MNDSIYSFTCLAFMYPLLCLSCLSFWNGFAFLILSCRLIMAAIAARKIILVTGANRQNGL